MNYQQQYLNNINDKIQDTHIPKHTIKYINLLSSSEDEHTDEDIEILNNSKQSIPTPQFKDKQYHKATTNTSIFNDHNTFTQKSDLQSHLKVHNGKKPYKCQHCNKAFGQNGHLTTRLRIKVDTGKRPYKCQHYTKAFKQKYAAIRHLRIHASERPSKCQHCEKAFKHKDTLTTHIRIHTSEKPYKCQHCPKSFITKHQLIQHLTVHTNEKPYKWSIVIIKPNGKGIHYLQRYSL